MSKGAEFRFAVEPGPFKYDMPEYQQQAEELIALSASLTDREKGRRPRHRPASRPLAALRGVHFRARPPLT